MSKIKSHFDYFIALFEGTTSTDWNTWWNNNHKELENSLSKREFLGLRHRKLKYVLELLEQEGIKPQNTYKFCPWCGSKLFKAIPGKTSKEEILDFGKKKGLSEIQNEAWIHPGYHCSECNYSCLVNFKK